MDLQTNLPKHLTIRKDTGEPMLACERCREVRALLDHWKPTVEPLRAFLANIEQFAAAHRECEPTDEFAGLDEHLRKTMPFAKHSPDPE